MVQMGHNSPLLKQGILILMALTFRVRLYAWCKEAEYNSHKLEEFDGLYY